jgi:hypothetical protein
MSSKTPRDTGALLADMDALLAEVDAPKPVPAPAVEPLPEPAFEPDPGPVFEPEPEPAFEPEPEPAMVRAPRTVPASEPPPLRPGDRAPAWWEPKPVIVGPDYAPAEEAPGPKPLPAVEKTDDDQGDDEPEDVEDTGDKEESKETEDGEETETARRWGLRGSGDRQYTRPTFSTRTQSKSSLAEWWTGRSPRSRWLLYNGTALAAGFALGVPQWFTAETAYLDATYDSWTEFYVCVWYGVAVAIWMFDHKSRRWFPPFALVARIPLISMVVGVLLHGSPDLSV